MIPKAESNMGEDARSSDRYRRIVLSGFSAGFVRFLSLAATFITIPLVSNHLGRERFGLWLTITSLIALLTFADFGISSGLVNSLAEFHGRGDHTSAAAFVSSAFYTLLSIAVTFGAIFAFAYQYVGWDHLFGLRSELAILEVGPSMAVFTACFLTAMPLGIAQRVHMGYQEGFRASIWLGLGSFFTVLTTFIAVAAGAGLPWIVLAASGGPVFAGFLNSVVLFGIERPWLRPTIRKAAAPTSKRLMRVGLMFFALSLAVAIGYQSDNIVIARILGADSVPDFAVPMKLFVIVPMILSVVLTPLWPAYGESIARGDFNWVSHAMKRSVIVGLSISIPLAIALFFFSSQLIRLWVGEDFRPSSFLLLGLAGWAILSGVLGPLAMLFNAANVISFQVRWSLTMAIFNLLFSIFLVTKVGVAGAVYGTLISQVLFLLIPYSLKLRVLLKSFRLAGTQAVPSDIQGSSPIPVRSPKGGA